MRDLSTKLSSCLWHKHCRVQPKVNQSAGVLEIGWTGAADTVKCSRCHLELDLWWTLQGLWGDATKYLYDYG